jgi:hypothetical protein
VTTGTAPYYAEAFFPMPGRCFRLIARAGEGGPTHCPEPAYRTGDDTVQAGVPLRHGRTRGARWLRGRQRGLASTPTG